MILRIEYTISREPNFHCSAWVSCGLSRKSLSALGILQFSDQLQWVAFREAVKSLPLFTVQLVESP